MKDDSLGKIPARSSGGAPGNQLSTFSIGDTGRRCSTRFLRPPAGWPSPRAVVGYGSERGPPTDVFTADSVVWNWNLAPTFTVDEISVLQVALDAAMTEATAKGFDFPLDLMLRRLFEAAESGERDPEKLKAMVLAGWNVAKDSPVR